MEGTVYVIEFTLNPEDAEKLLKARGWHYSPGRGWEGPGNEYQSFSLVWAANLVVEEIIRKEIEGGR